MRRSLAPILFAPPLPLLGLNFAGGQYNRGNQRFSDPTTIPGWSYSGSVSGTGATVRTATDLSGNVISFANGVPRITNQGILIEQAATNILLNSNDLTQGSWVKVNTTAAMDQIGPDLVVNSASSLTATAINGTALQTVTLVSSARLVSVYLKRITGVGTVSLSGDGVTWTAQTLTTSWARYSLASATVTNPVTGIQFGTSGDKIAVAYFDNETGAVATSPIPTTSAAVTRSQDVAKITMVAGALFPSSGTAIARFISTPNNGVGAVFAFNDNSTSNRIDMRSNQVGLVEMAGTSAGSGGTLSQGSPVASTAVKAAQSWATGFFAIASQGAVAQTSSGLSVPAKSLITQFLIGLVDTAGTPLNNYVKSVQVTSGASTAGQVSALSGGQ